MRILGIDPGSRTTGFGVLDYTDRQAHYVASGSVSSVKGDFPARLRCIFEAVHDIVHDYQPDVMAIESIFVHKNPSSALKLGHARSAALCASFSLNIEICEYAPREIKQAVVGTGAANKEQVQHMVISLLKLNGKPSPDAADALAAALCHGHQSTYQRRVRAQSLAGARS